MKKILLMTFVLGLIFIISNCDTQNDSGSTENDPGILYNNSTVFLKKYNAYNELVQEVLEMGDANVTFNYDYIGTEYDGIFTDNILGDGDNTQDVVNIYATVEISPKPATDPGITKYCLTKERVDTEKTILISDESGDYTITIPIGGKRHILRSLEQNNDGSYTASTIQFETYFDIVGNYLYHSEFNEYGNLVKERICTWGEYGYVKEVDYFRNQTDEVHPIKDIVVCSYDAFGLYIREDRTVITQLGSTDQIKDNYIYKYNWDSAGKYVSREDKYALKVDGADKTIKSEQLVSWYHDQYENIADYDLCVKSSFYKNNSINEFTQYKYDTDGFMETKTKKTYFYNNKLNETPKIEEELLNSYYIEDNLFVIREETRIYDVNNQTDPNFTTSASILRTISTFKENDFKFKGKIFNNSSILIENGTNKANYKQM